MAVAAAESRPADGLDLQKELMRRSPIQWFTRLRQKSLPEAIGQLFEVLAPSSGSGDIKDDSAVWIEAAHHGQAKL
jgi:hypothetical protein